MALYTGENVIVTHTATYDGLELNPDNVDGVFVTIYNSLREVIIDETPMVWNPEAVVAFPLTGRWEYDWDTSPGATPDSLTTGTYRAKVTVYSGSDINWEFKKVKLKRNPV